MTAKHTPGPWVVTDSPSVNDETRIGVDAKSRSICGMTGGFYTRPGQALRDETLAENRANAAFIVRACNSHADLLECVRGYVRMADNLLGRKEFTEKDWVDLRTALTFIAPQARAAIAKATGQGQ